MLFYYMQFCYDRRKYTSSSRPLLVRKKAIVKIKENYQKLPAYVTIAYLIQFRIVVRSHLGPSI